MREKRKDSGDSRRVRWNDNYSGRKKYRQGIGAEVKKVWTEINMQEGADVMGTELRDCVSRICMKEEMRKAVIENVKERTKGTAGACGEAMKDNDRNRRAKGHIAVWKRNVAAAVLVAALAGAAAVPVRALVNSIVRERMEQMPAEEKDTYAETLTEQQVSASGFSREYTPEERERYREMGQKYQDGIFPEGEVTKVDTVQETEAYEFCYLTSTDMFYLPERELKDEELLQIIDFTVKREYAWAEHYEKEHAAKLETEKEQEQVKIAANTEGGGITMQQAEEIAAQKLADIYGIDGEGFDKNSYYDEDARGGREVYCVNWTNIITHQYYYFYIDAKDGHMSWAAHSGEDISEAPYASADRVREQIPVLQKKAEDFMKNEIQETYDRVYVSYLLRQDGNAEKQVSFYLAKEDGSACEIIYLWDGTLTEIDREKDISGRKDGKAVELWDGEEYREAVEVFRELAG